MSIGLPRLVGVGSAFPPHYYDQSTLLDALKSHWALRHYNVDRLDRMHRNVLVGGRHLALPLESYAGIADWGQANDAWVECALDIGTIAVENALKDAGLSAGDVGTLVFVTTTGVATPSLDALLMNRLAFPVGLRRVPIFGLGCAAGVAGVARAADFLTARPYDTAVLLSVELCSLTLQREDLSVANLIGTGLFGDGAAAVVLAGADHRDHPGPRVVGSATTFFPDTENMMGWTITHRGFGLRLSADVPGLVGSRLGGVVDDFLARHGLARDDVARWICHPGGPKVLEAMQDSLDLIDGALDASWRVLRARGNLSSATSLLVLQETMRDPPVSGSHGLLVALGPGFAAELVLVRW